MSRKVPPPIATLRGHTVGVTSLTHYEQDKTPYLLSGDEEGNLIIWDLNISRKFKQCLKLVPSRIQSLRVIKTYINNMEHHILIVQSRNDGLYLIDLSTLIRELNSPPKILANYPTYDSLFSRGDAMSIEGNLAILAYPSCIENHLTTVRIIESNVRTKISGTAQRYSNEMSKKSSVFDMIIKKNSRSGFLIFVGYEDGCLCVFKISLEITERVPVLNSEGLKIDLIKTYDLKIGDFVSAFDVVFNNHNDFTLICGCPLKKLIIINDAVDLISSEPCESHLDLKRQGTSAVAIRPDRKLFVVAGWDHTVKVYSMKSRKHLASLDHHSGQVQSLLFIERPDILEFNEKDDQANLSDTKSRYLLCYASMEGIISISVIY